MPRRLSGKAEGLSLLTAGRSGAGKGGVPVGTPDVARGSGGSGSRTERGASPVRNNTQRRVTRGRRWAAWAWLGVEAESLGCVSQRGSDRPRARAPRGGARRRKKGGGAREAPQTTAPSSRLGPLPSLEPFNAGFKKRRRGARPGHLCRQTPLGVRGRVCTRASSGGATPQDSVPLDLRYAASRPGTPPKGRWHRDGMARVGGPHPHHPPPRGQPSRAPEVTGPSQLETPPSARPPRLAADLGAVTLVAVVAAQREPGREARALARAGDSASFIIMQVHC